jgi:hypothetical protein
MFGNFNLPTIINIIITIFIVITISIVIFNFFDISISNIIPYIIWSIALFIFFIILPKTQGDLFN